MAFGVESSREESKYKHKANNTLLEKWKNFVSFYSIRVEVIITVKHEIIDQTINRFTSFLIRGETGVEKPYL